MSTLLKIWADLAFNGEAATAPMTRCGIDLELVGRKGKIGFEVEPRNGGGSSRPWACLAATAGSWSITKAAP